MRTPTCLCLLLICMLISCTPTQEKHEIDYTSYVNPFIGTDFTGNTYPGAQAPFGMVQLSPDNGLPGWDRISGYFTRTVRLPDSATRTSPVPELEICMISLLCLSRCLTKKQKLHWAFTPSSPTMTKAPMQAIIRYA